jgi:hypothetical protein
MASTQQSRLRVVPEFSVRERNAVAALLGRPESPLGLRTLVAARKGVDESQRSADLAMIDSLVTRLDGGQPAFLNGDQAFSTQEMYLMDTALTEAIRRVYDRDSRLAFGERYGVSARLAFHLRAMLKLDHTFTKHVIEKPRSAQLHMYEKVWAARDIRRGWGADLPDGLHTAVAPDRCLLSDSIVMLTGVGTLSTVRGRLTVAYRQAETLVPDGPWNTITQRVTTQNAALPRSR